MRSAFLNVGAGSSFLISFVGALASFDSPVPAPKLPNATGGGNAGFVVNEPPNTLVGASCFFCCPAPAAKSRGLNDGTPKVTGCVSFTLPWSSPGFPTAPKLGRLDVCSLKLVDWNAGVDWNTTLPLFVADGMVNIGGASSRCFSSEPSLSSSTSLSGRPFCSAASVAQSASSSASEPSLSSSTSLSGRPFCSAASVAQSASSSASEPSLSSSTSLSGRPFCSAASVAQSASSSSSEPSLSGRPRLSAVTVASSIPSSSSSVSSLSGRPCCSAAFVMSFGSWSLASNPSPSDTSINLYSVSSEMISGRLS